MKLTVRTNPNGWTEIIGANGLRFAFANTFKANAFVMGFQRGYRAAREAASELELDDNRPIGRAPGAAS